MDLEEESQDQERENQVLGEFWAEEIQGVVGDDKWKLWKIRTRRLTARYRDERVALNDVESQTTKYNTLWSNVEYLTPAIYFQTPKPYVERRFLDQDDVARASSQILERSLSYNLDCERFDYSMQKIMKDYFLCGRGILKFMYKPTIEKTEAIDEFGQPVYNEKISYEEVKHHYVFNEDFIHGYARCWDEVPWVAFKSYLTKKELASRFGEDKAKEINLDYSPSSDPIDNFPYPNPEKSMRQKKAVIWEIWDKQERQVIMFAPGSSNMILERTDDPLQLEGFFPCPMPLYATMTNDTLIPIPDYFEYQDQANELDMLTARISSLTKVLRLSGVYDASAEGLQRLLNEGTENQLVPVESWATLSQNGGLEKSIYFFPVKIVAETLLAMYQTRDQIKKDLDEISGLYSIRAADVNTPVNTQKNQQQSSSLRLQQKQKLVAAFTRDCIRIIAEIMCKHFQPETFALMSDYVQLVDADLQKFTAAMQLLKDSNMRKFRVDIETDSTVALDETKEKSDRIEYAQALVNAIKELGPIVEAKPNFEIAARDLILFIARGFKSGRSLESTLEQSFMQMAQMPEQKPQSEALQQGEQQQKLQDKKTQGSLTETQAELQADIVRSNVETQNAAKLKLIDHARDRQKLTETQSVV